MDVSNLDAGALTRQTAGPEGRQTAEVRETVERVGLLHELRQLRRPEELLDGRRQRTDVHERLRRDRFGVLRGHALLDDALHAGEADADLVGDELADRAHATVAEVVDVVDVVVGVALVQREQVLDRRVQVVLRDDGDLVGESSELSELRVDLVAADLREVVALGVEVHALEQARRRLRRRRLARTQLAVDVHEGFARRADRIAREGLAHGLGTREVP